MESFKYFLEDTDFKVGDKVTFNYRSAKNVEGTIVGIHEKGKDNESTSFEIKPLKKDHHEGEPETIHRIGSKLKHRG